MPSDELSALNAECPVCEHYGPQYPSGSGRFTCSLCDTSFGTARRSDESVVTFDQGEDVDR